MSLFFDLHWSLNSLAASYTGQAGLYLPFDRLEICVPSSNDFRSRGRRVRKSLFFTEIVQKGVVLREQRILRHDLGCEQMRKDGEGRRDDRG